MKNKGFTLVELLAVIVIIGLLMAIAIPTTTTIMKRINESAYDTLIENIEGGVKSSYLNEKNTIEASNYKCIATYNGDDLTKLTYQSGKANTNSNNEYPCIEVTLNKLINDGVLEYNSGDKMIEPVTKKDIGNCKVYIYIKYKNVQAWFDKENCIPE